MRRVIALFAAVAVAGAGCTEPAQQPPTAPEPAIEVAWREVTPPLPPGTTGRVAVRDATFCAGQWYVVGAVYDSAGETVPAGWRSADGGTWTHLTFAPGSYYGERNILASVGCRDGKVAMVGAKSGGAHGNPRTSTWYERADGTFVEVIAAFSLYGGPEAVNVGRITSGPAGWLIVGNRTSGAAVWVSPDATEFKLIDKDPQLSSDAGVDTAARDAVFADGRWTAVGSGTVPGRVPRVPLSWVSEDGQAWRRQPVPRTPEFEDMQRVVAYRDELLAVGLRGNTFGVWHRKPGGDWTAGTAFGRVDTTGRASPFVSGLTPVDTGLVAAVSDGSGYALWASPDGQRWRPVTTPTRTTTAGEHITTAIGSGRSVLLLADDGKAGRIWLADPMRYS